MKYFPIYEDPYRAQLGLKPLDLKEWLERASDFDAQIALRKKLVRENSDEVLILQPGSDEACFELFELVSDRVSLGSKPANAKDAMMAIAGAVQEDFVILSGGDTARPVAALVCFPSRWLLASKMGQDSDGIHAPVPGFQAIARQTRGFLQAIVPDKPMWRLNWTIHDSDRLFCPRPVPHEPIAPEKIIASTFFRCERQTLRRMPRSNQVVFTIRTYVTPMSEVIADLDRRERLKKTLVSLSPDVANYKGMGSFIHTLIKAL